MNKKRQYKADIERFNKEILNLRNLKLEEQNTLLEYSSQIDKIKNQISNDENFNDIEIDLDDNVITDKNNKIEKLH